MFEIENENRTSIQVTDKKIKIMNLPIMRKKMQEIEEGAMRKSLIR